jgi:DNA-directed RNA polymerase subunit RPC12/RpoP
MPEENLKCSECGADVPPTESSSTTSIGPEGALTQQPAREYTKCPKCGVSLERNVDEPSDQWRLAPGS